MVENQKVTIIIIPCCCCKVASSPVHCQDLVSKLENKKEGLQVGSTWALFPIYNVICILSICTSVERDLQIKPIKCQVEGILMVVVCSFCLLSFCITCESG